MLVEEGSFEVVHNEGNSTKIKVIGVGGAGGNALNNMVEHGLSGVEFIAINTDKQALDGCKKGVRPILIGETVTGGQGAGNDPEVGRKAAEESEALLIDILGDAEMVFITAGMGGGTGTGASPVLAHIAKEMGILTVAVVTKPFDWESGRRENAELGIRRLREHVDAMIVINNNKIYKLNPDEPLIDLFKKVDDVLRQGVQGVTDIIRDKGYINADFNDVKTIMKYKGMALMAIAEASGENRAEEAVRKALSNPLVDHEGILGAKGVLYNITTGLDFTGRELQTIGTLIQQEAGDVATMVYGWVQDPSMNGNIRLTIIATGFETPEVVPSNEKNVNVKEKLEFKKTIEKPDKNQKNYCEFNPKIPGMLRNFLDS
ncbi:cell division protein FtsZ [Thermosulfidibacter takaii ABI70S6]|uniref:Cell division protein FtsZ n=1 Tax=Thermosulfidibacter takaii (strain DSM 17441 / JCM 13301 / NBRC 103674 / ABI70S6) TaxID=1298851 RepID=A0A0S3QU63_THET7|nr:cell division protein FtsZ [Thermosulfidibacter takaii]BAT71841.1 cell division protein FtsZ [Thermosulfidibacter takaii ABI70S6]